MWFLRILFVVVMTCAVGLVSFYYGHVRGGPVVKEALAIPIVRQVLTHAGIVRPGLDKVQVEPSRFVRQTRTAKKVLVFVHGVMGTADETWAGANHGARTYWPELVKDDERFNDYDIFVVSYYSPQAGKAPNIFGLSSALIRDLEDYKIYPTGTLQSQYEEVVFICHSMGNLVVRTSLITRSLPENSSTQIPLILSIASPSEGSALANLAKDVLSENPQFVDMVGIEANSFLQLLNAVWERRAFDTEIACAYELRNYPGIGGKVVEQKSATAICTRTGPRPIEEDHITIVKPGDRQHPIHAWLAEEVKRPSGQKGWELPRWADKEVVVGGKDFDESNIHAAMITLVLRAHLPHLKVTPEYSRGHASRLYTSLRDRQIDIYPEYDGSILREYLQTDIAAEQKAGQMVKLDAEGVNKELRKTPATWNMRFFPHLGFHNPYVLVMLKSKAAELGVIGKDGKVTLSDLATVSEGHLILAADQEFSFRKEWLELQKAYKLRFKDYKFERHSGIYELIKNSKRDRFGLVGVGFGTDLALNRDDADFITVEDDRQVFPYYHPAPFVHILLLRKFPEIEGALKKLDGFMDTREMSDLLQEVRKYVVSHKALNDKEKSDLEGVVGAFLKRKRVIP